LKKYWETTGSNHTANLTKHRCGEKKDDVKESLSDNTTGLSCYH